MASTNFSADKLRLKAELLYSRQGILPFVAGTLLILTVLSGVLIVPGQIAAKDKAERELDRLTQAQVSARTKPGQQHLSPAQSLARVLADPEITNAQIRALLDFAANNGVTVVQADFRRVVDPQKAYSQLQISLPVKADYLSLRRFIFNALAEMPALSLDQLIIKREQSNSSQVDAQLVLSVWQKQANVPIDRSVIGSSN